MGWVASQNWLTFSWDMISPVAGADNVFTTFKFPNSPEKTTLNLRIGRKPKTDETIPTPKSVFASQTAVSKSSVSATGYRGEGCYPEHKRLIN